MTQPAITFDKLRTERLYFLFGGSLRLTSTPRRIDFFVLTSNDFHAPTVVQGVSMRKNWQPVGNRVFDIPAHLCFSESNLSEQGCRFEAPRGVDGRASAVS